MTAPIKEGKTMSKSMETLLSDWLYDRFAHNCRASGMWLLGQDIYSFGKHYLLARRAPGYILLNTHNYSIRTAGQLSKVRSSLRKECYKADDILPFDSSLDLDPPWWVCEAKPPLGQVLSCLLRYSGEPSPRTLWTVSQAYGIDMGERATVPSHLWGGDPDKLMEVALGRGEGSAVAVLHHLAVDEGVEAALRWVDNNTRQMGRTTRETLVSLLVDRYGSDEVPAGSFSGYKKKFWDLMMATPEEARPQAAAELMISSRSLKAYAEGWLNAYNNAQHRKVSI